ncbi:MAG: DUF58 domain-containing protein [Paludibacteraceae bacterium]|nr:DUF58 domain-containing protein [Paludibacteraceae bacterium]
METSELLNKVRKIEIKTRGLSNNIFAGEYHTAFKGKGMTFSEVREYQYGDEVRTIDWNVTARFRKPFVKVFEEEREMTVMLLIDLSSSSLFGSTSAYKRDVITEIAATIAFSAIQNNDKIGAIFFTDKIEKFIPPQKGRKHILFIIRELLEFKPESNATDISLALRYLTNVIKKRCTSFLISDFIDDNLQQDAFTIANRKHDVVALQVYDIRDVEIPPVGLVKFKDAETGQRLWVDTNSSKVREMYKKYWVDSMANLNQMVKYAGIDFVSLEVTEDYVKALMRLFNMRK